jgi:diguanylate cyclase (GGDEF)-like protein
MTYYIYKNDLYDQVDSLTLMLNQKMFQKDITSLSHPYLLVVFGIDNIKNVNEIYGLDTGDKCISIVAETIRSFYKKHGICYRISGTEFCCIIKHTSLAIEDINDEFFHAIVKKTYDTRELPFVTVGYALHEKNENFEEVMRRANINRLEFRETRNQRIFF